MTTEYVTPNGAIILTRKCYSGHLSELIDEGIFRPFKPNPYHYDGGMNFLGVLGEHQNHGISDADVLITCEWKGKVCRPQYPPHIRVIKYEPNVLYDHNGSGSSYGNYEENDPRYLLSAGSRGLLLKKIKFLKNTEVDFWRNRQNFITKIFLFFLGRRWRLKWAKKKTEQLNDDLKSSPKEIFVCDKPNSRLIAHKRH